MFRDHRDSGASSDAEKSTDNGSEAPCGTLPATESRKLANHILTACGVATPSTELLSEQEVALVAINSFGEDWYCCLPSAKKLADKACYCERIAILQELTRTLKPRSDLRPEAAQLIANLLANENEKEQAGSIHNLIGPPGLQVYFATPDTIFTRLGKEFEAFHATVEIPSRIYIPGCGLETLTTLSEMKQASELRFITNDTNQFVADVAAHLVKPVQVPNFRFYPEDFGNHVFEENSLGLTLLSFINCSEQSRTKLLDQIATATAPGGLVMSLAADVPPSGNAISSAGLAAALSAAGFKLQRQVCVRMIDSCLSKDGVDIPFEAMDPSDAFAIASGDHQLLRPSQGVAAVWYKDR